MDRVGKLIDDLTGRGERLARQGHNRNLDEAAHLFLFAAFFRIPRLPPDDCLSLRRQPDRYFPTFIYG